ncbi:hypothetical protein Q4511_00405 [Paracoccus sp. 1_MG-2023]|uniref:hypothetical protein n=1 Tax=unclassified Paracoccus (in: a-proteobacteria) TaxID=2688777 RepID=UPI001C081D7F|nr:MULTISPECIES: hypothetical protein [unclassified Paracoccus (in: a-proteobacteria)]MBU2957782.1 hypothetical protein [Paracoccus sp. C2R09]MDO6667370.1 hypothetical protein [Paracoccus sp. 1_MG-2023]
MDDRQISEFEGRLLAQRRLLARLIAAMPDAAREDIRGFMTDRLLPRDGQEDPGAVPSVGQALDHAMADEFRRIDRLVGDRLNEG